MRGEGGRVVEGQVRASSFLPRTQFNADLYVEGVGRV